MEGRRGGVDTGVDADLLLLQDLIERFAVAVPFVSCAQLI